MHVNFIAFAVPVFSAFIYLEYYYSKKGKQEVYHFEESVANLNVGIVERVTDLFTTGLFFFFFSWLHQHFAIFNIKSTIITWLLLFMSTDFIWYWYHRFGHTVNIFWGAHVVHHQSDDYNYTTSVRITIFQSVARCLFWSILPILGFPPHMITVFLLVHGAYPFFTHTQLIGKLGVLEKFLVTPSHHRVHHSSNEEYLDKNYGDILIIWDKLFGTYVEETVKPVYGLTAPLKSYSFLWQMFHFPLEMLIAFRRANSLKEKLKVVFGKPDDIDPRIRLYLEKKFLIRRDVKLTDTLHRYIKVQTIFTLGFVFFIALFEYYLNLWHLVTASLFVIVSVINTGAMLEKRKWIFYLEYFRLILLGVLLILFYANVYVETAVFAVWLITLLFYHSIENRYYGYFYSYSRS